MVRLTQKTAKINDKHIAYVRAEICLGGKTFPVTLPKDYGSVRANFNDYCKTLGFIVGEVADPSTVPEKVVEK